MRVREILLRVLICATVLPVLFRCSIPTQAKPRILSRANYEAISEGSSIQSVKAKIGVPWHGEMESESVVVLSYLVERQFGDSSLATEARLYFREGRLYAKSLVVK